MPSLVQLLINASGGGRKPPGIHAPKHAKRGLDGVPRSPCGAVLLLVDPWAGLAYWSVKSTLDMVYAHCVGRRFTLLPPSASGTLKSLIALAVAHPIFVATTLLVMPLRTARWKGRPAA